MTTAKIEKAINALPNSARERFLRKLWHQYEDICDRGIRKKVLEEGEFYLWSNGKKKSHVKRRRHLKTRKKISRSGS